jgi:hypothetical protein
MRVHRQVVNLVLLFVRSTVIVAVLLLSYRCASNDLRAPPGRHCGEPRHRGPPAEHPRDDPPPDIDVY